ncbi:unnamed protein product [Aspergillus oryzae]|uniref:Unnamed protein product n=1 Tax=Aspergillus oryzae TaxID=5062 RepID=A0AAN5BXB5_ASPOZ|nr:unnamed protein product [Aspergillus oryzae]
MITEITLKLATIPEKQSVAVATFPSIREAAATASKIMRTGIQIAALEMMDETQMMVINKNGGAGVYWLTSPDLSKKESGQLGLFLSVLGHVGDGNFHQAVMYNPNDPEQKQSVRDCVLAMVHRAVEMEGTVSVSNLIVKHLRISFRIQQVG